MTETAQIFHFRQANQTQTWGVDTTYETVEHLQEFAEAAEPTEKDEPKLDIDELFSLLRELREFKVGAYARTTTTPVAIPAPYEAVHTALTEAMEAGRPIALRRENDVPLHSLLRFAGGLTAFLCVASIAMWLSDVPPLLNPFAAMLGLVVSPFFYAMGLAARLKV